MARASRSWRSDLQQELDDFTRLISGAFLFGIPMLYTMEMWWIGTYADLWKLVLFLGLAFAVTVLLAYYSPLKGRTNDLSGAVAQAIESVAVGIVASLVVLVVLDRIGWGEPLDAVVGMIVIQAVPLSIGAAAANALLAVGEDRDRHGDGSDGPQTSPSRALLNDLGASFAGAVFIGLPLAPTEEIAKLAEEMELGNEIALVLLSLALTYAIVFESGFDPRQRRARTPGPFQRPATETALAYMVALVVALASLYLFDQVEVGDPLLAVTSQVLALGFPTAIGGAAGRLVI